MLSTSPVFDLKVLKRGVPLMVTAPKWLPINNNREWPAMIADANPLSIKVLTIDSEGAPDHRTIRIEDVTDHDRPVKLVLLVKQEAPPAAGE